jgi:hypothetical protein
MSMNRRRNATIRLTGFGKPKTLSPAVEAFLRAFFDASYPSPFSPNERTERALSGIDAVVEVTPQYAGIHIDRLRALTRKQGEGTKAMRFLTSLADKHGVKLSLYAKPFGSEPMNRDTLVNFYRRFGFYPDEAEEEDEGTEMYRWPRQTPSRETLRNPARKAQHVYHLTYASDLPFIARQGLVPRADTEAAWDNEPGVYFVNVFGYEAGAPESEEPAWLRFPAPSNLPPKFFTGMNEAHANVVFPASSIDVWVDTRGRPVSKSDKGRWKPLVEVVRPRANPARKPSQTDTPTSSEAFKRWFGKSKVVDAKRKPLVVYHAGFDVVRSPEGAFRLSESGKAGSGIYFTPSFSEAERYLGRAHAMHHEAVKIAKYNGLPIPPPPAVTAVYLSVQKPAVVVRHGKDEPSETLARKVFPKGVSWEDEDYEPAALLRYTRAAGYDGVFVVNGKREVEEIVVFDPTQVKSANMNAGTFDPADPSILRNPASRNPASRNPRRNPARKPSQTDTPAFQKWFGASKVVNAKGEPRVMYHGTAVANFDAFSTLRPPFFTSDKNYARMYSDKGKGGKARELEVFLRIERPFDTRHDGQAVRLFNADFLPWYREQQQRYAHLRERDIPPAVLGEALTFLDADDFWRYLRIRSRRGDTPYDGLVVDEGSFPAMWEEGTGIKLTPEAQYAWVPLDPTQVKSAKKNVGTFDPADPSILRNPRRNPSRKAKPPTLAAAGLPEVWFHGTQKTFGKLKAQGGACIWLADKAGAMAYATPHYGRRSAIRLIEVTLAPDTRVVDLADASDPIVREFIRLDASASNMRWHGRETVTDAELVAAIARWNAEGKHYGVIEARGWSKAYFRKAGADALLVRDVAGWGGHAEMPSLCLLNAKKVVSERDVTPDLSLVPPEDMPKYENPARTKTFSNTPLTAEETKLFGRATDYLTEWVCDGWRSLPARIAELEEKTTALTNSEKRELIDWFYRNAPGDW